jgi:hypothetical protein
MNVPADSQDPYGVAEHKLGMLDPPQPMGILPTRQFWKDPDNRQLVQGPHVILVGVLLLVLGLLDLPWWGAVALALAMIVLLRGLLERSLRQAAKLRLLRASHHGALGT